MYLTMYKGTVEPLHVVAVGIEEQLLKQQCVCWCISVYVRGGGGGGGGVSGIRKDKYVSYHVWGNCWATACSSCWDRGAVLRCWRWRLGGGELRLPKLITWTCRSITYNNTTKKLQIQRNTFPYIYIYTYR